MTGVRRLVDMSDEEFRDAVMQAVKRRTDFPEWWRLVLHPDLIDDTEEVIRDAVRVAEGQALNPGRFPHAGSFVLKMRGVLAEVNLARLANQ